MAELLGPNLLIAGAARSGTSYLAESLATHPDVFLTTPKEPGYLAFGEGPCTFTGPGDDATVNRVTVTSEADYRRLFAGAQSTAVRIDGSVAMLYRADDAVRNIARVCPDARVVAVLRDPVDRAFSAYMYLRGRGYEECQSFDEALAREDERVALGWHHMWHYTRMSLYAASLATFVDALGADRVLVRTYDELQRDPLCLLNAITRFVGLAPFERLPIDGTVNRSGAPRSRVLTGVLRTTRSSTTFRRVVRPMVPLRFRERVRAANLSDAAVPRDVRARLLPRFAADLQALGPLVDEVPPGWSAL